MDHSENNTVSDTKIQYLKLIREKFETAMPEVHRQVKVYEEKLASGNLTPEPKNSPFFSE